MRRCWSLRVYTRSYSHADNGFLPSFQGRAAETCMRQRAMAASSTQHTQPNKPRTYSCLPFTGKLASLHPTPSTNSSSFMRPIPSMSIAVRSCQCCALDPDYYRVKKEEGIPVGVRLKIWNLPEDFGPQHFQEFKDWFGPPDVVNPVHVDKVEMTDDPAFLEQNIRAFVDFVTLDDACMAIVKYDGCRFRGKCVRMDFVQKRPHEKEYGGPRSRLRAGGIRRNMGANSGYVANPNYNPPPPQPAADGSVPTSDGTASGPTPEPQVPNYGPGYGAPPPRPSSMNRIFVGNLSWTTDDMSLTNLFKDFGNVLEARIVRDRDTGRSRGFGFVTMSSAEEMKAAISAMSGKQVEGRSLTVNEAAARP